MFYTKKPVTIEAFQMTAARRADNSEWPVWLSKAWQKNRTEVGSVHPTQPGTGDGTVSVNTLEGEMLVNFGDYIIKGIKGELYPCKPDIFEASYTPTSAAVNAHREVLDHRVEGKGGGADDTRVLVLDEPGQGGACHKYAVTTGDGKPLLFVEFQNGPIQEVGLNGAQQEHLLAIVVDRLRSFQAGQFSSRYNAIALTKCEEALMWLQRRTVDRVRRGVEGYNKA